MKTRWMALIALTALLVSVPTAFAGPPEAAVASEVVAPQVAPAAHGDVEEGDLDAFLDHLANEGEEPEARSGHCAAFTCNVNFDCRDDCPYIGVCHDADPNIDCSGWCECIT